MADLLLTNELHNELNNKENNSDLNDPIIIIPKFTKFDDQEEDTNTNLDFECSICFDSYDINDVLFIDVCAHMFCIECLKEYCINEVNRGNCSIVCPDRNCHEYLNHEEIITILNGANNIIEKYEDFLYTTKLEEYDDIKWCPVAHCSSPCPMDDTKIVKCLCCNYRFCYNCSKEPHEGFTCEEFKKCEGKLNSFEDWLEAKGGKVKQCPKCNSHCEKISGCDTVPCAKCRTQFCWLCTEILVKNVKHFNVPNGCINTYVHDSDDDSDGSSSY